MPLIDLEKIRPNPLNPRLEFRQQTLDGLVASIKTTGVIQAIIVRPDGEDRYEIVVGERRFRAAQRAGLTCIPALIRAYTDGEVLEAVLIENLHRDDLSAAEKGSICQRLRDQFPEKYPTWEVALAQLGIDKGTLSKWLRTLGLPESVQHLIGPSALDRKTPDGKIDYETAVQIARKVEGPQRQIEVAETLAAAHLPRQQAMAVVRKAVEQPAVPVEMVVDRVIDETPLALPFSYGHAQAIAKGIKTQTARKSKAAKMIPGAIVRVMVTHFADIEITAVARKRLGEFDEADAVREGGYTLEEFKQVWTELHGQWDGQQKVAVIQFVLRKVVDGA